MPELAISAEKVAFLIEKTREFDVKESTSDPDGGWDRARGNDDFQRMIQTLARAVDDHGAELVAFFHREMSLRGLRQRELRGDVVNARGGGQPF
jgi:hypothetical protein